MKAAIVALALLIPWAAPARAAALSEGERQAWAAALKKSALAPSCCGACPVLSLEQARLILGHLEGSDAGGEGERLFESRRKALVSAFRREAELRGLKIDERTWSREDK